MLEATFTPSPSLAIEVVRILGSSTVLEGLKVPRVSAARKTLLKILQALLGGGLLVLLVASTTSGAPIQAWHVIVLVILAYFSGAIATEFFRSRDQTALMAALLETEQPVTYKMDEWGLYAVSGQTTTSTPWAGVRRVLVADGFVLFARGDGVSFVPRVAFQSDRHMDEFAAFASSKLRGDA